MEGKPTALVHEAYLPLVDAKGLACKDRTHFFALSAQVMRRILVDAARARVSAKRGGDSPALNHWEAINLDEIAGSASQKSAEVLALDQALDDLARLDARKARVIELHRASCATGNWPGRGASASWVNSSFALPLAVAAEITHD